MTEASSNDGRTPILAARAGYLIGMAGRAPSVHNTQPWCFTVSGDAIELLADARRQLRLDPDGREMVISCGAALYGLHLAVRSLGYQPEVKMVPGLPGEPVLARVRPGEAVPATPGERKLLQALSRRHTHRAGLAAIAGWLTVRHVKGGAPEEAERPATEEPLPVFQY